MRLVFVKIVDGITQNQIASFDPLKNVSDMLADIIRDAGSMGFEPTKETLEIIRLYFTRIDEDSKIRYSVKTMRSAGLEAKWFKTSSGAPYIAVRFPTSEHVHLREEWWVVDNSMFGLMRIFGVLEGFKQSTLLGDIFSLDVEDKAGI
jgi:hypothetical protein